MFLPNRLIRPQPPVHQWQHRSLWLFLLALCIHTLITSPVPRAASNSITFVVVGDFDNSSNAASVASLIDSWLPDFIVTTGDNRYDSDIFDDNVGRYYCPYLADAGSGNYCNGGTSVSNRFFPSLGNHDYTDAGGLPEYLNYFTLPGNGIPSSLTSGNERYYDFTWGPVHFFAIDSQGAITSSSDRNAQQAWLQTQLAASTSPWQVVFLHHPPYSSGLNSASSVMRWPFAAWGADVVFAGHSHTYERISHDGIPYFVSGLGGRTASSFGAAIPGSQVRYNNNYGAMRITAESAQILFEFININDSVIDSFVIEGDSIPGLSVPITSPSDDAEEQSANGMVTLNSPTLELGEDPGNGQQILGLRFVDLPIPQGATINSAYLEFSAISTDNLASNVTIHAMASDNAPAFSSSVNDLSSRSLTAAITHWTLPPWDTVGEIYQSPDISALIQEVTDRTGWLANNAIMFAISGSGTRTASAYESDPASAPTLVLEFTPPPPDVILDIRISVSIDDVEQQVVSGSMYTTSSDLELGEDPGSNGNQTIGLRFRDLNIPRGSYIETAYLEFTVDEPNSITTDVLIQAHAIDSAPSFSGALYDVTDRPLTVAATPWNIAPWSTVGALKQSPDISSLLQEVIDRNGWQVGNNLVLVISGSGERSGDSYDGDPATAPLLHVEYSNGTPPNLPPTSSFTEQINYLQVDFNDTSLDTDGNITAWNWDFGDNNTSAQQHPQHSYANNGTYLVQLIVTDDEGATDTTSHNVSVTANVAPTASFTEIINHRQVTFNDTSNDSDGTINSWLWDFGDNQISTQQHPQHLYDVGGTYTVQLTVTDDQGATGITSHNITLIDNVAPTASFTESINGRLVTFSDTSTDNDGNIISWAWDFGDNTSDTSQHPQHLYDQPGTYLVGLTVTDDDGATHQHSYTVTAVAGNILPSASFDLTINHLQVSFTDTSTDSDGSVIAWNWDFGDGNNSTSQHPDHLYLANGTYLVQLHISDNQGGSDLTSQSVTVAANVPPTASFSEMNNNLQVTFTDNSSDDQPTLAAWNWDFGDGNTSTAQHPLHTYNNAGSYLVQLEVTDQQGLSDITSHNVTVTDDSIVFAILGDFGMVNSAAASVATQLASWDPDFIITVGDNRYDTFSFDQTLGQYYCAFLTDVEIGSYCNGGTSPINAFFPSLGNHDYTDAGGVTEYLNYLTLPGAGVETSGTSTNERYYDFVRGPVHFFALDSYDALRNATVMSEQQSWLQTQLAASTSRWQVVYFHHAAYSSSDHHGSDPAMQWPFAQWGADAVFAGHNHIYERLSINGIPYFVNGIGGRTLRPLGNPIPGSQVMYNSNFGAMRVAANSSQMRYELIVLNGDVIDSHTYRGVEESSLTARISASTDDAEEVVSSGAMSLDSNSLTLAEDPVNGEQQLGLRFVNLAVPHGATIEEAYLEFTVLDSNSQPAALTIQAQASDNAPPFSASANDLSSRVLTTASMSWPSSSWPTIGAQQRSPDISALVQEVVNRDNWITQNAMAFAISGNGIRSAHAFESAPVSAPLLYIKYQYTPPTTTMLDIRITTGNDDVEQQLGSGSMLFTSQDIELGEDPTANGIQAVGLRFNNINIPANTTINAAHLEFVVDEIDSIATTMTIQAQAADDAEQFSNNNFDLTDRPLTNASISWDVPAWPFEGTTQRSPDIAALLQEVLNRNGWNSNNSLVFVISGTGERTAESFEGQPTLAPLLHVEYGNNPPSADFSEVINNLQVSFTDSSSDSDGSLVSWLWEFGDTQTSTQQNPQHTYSANGNYTVQLTVTDNQGATGVTSHSITVDDGNMVPIADFSEVISNLQVTFSDHSSDSDGNLVSWLWEFGDTQTSTLQHPQHTYGANGTYTVQLTVTDNQGATGVTSRQLTVASNFAPIASFSETTNYLDATFSDTSTDSDGSIVAWSWDFGDGANSAVKDPIHSYVTAGSYLVELIVTDNQGATGTSSHNVTVATNVAPTASFTETSNYLDVTFSDTSTDSDGTIVDWSWDFGDGASASIKDPIHSYAIPGTYLVQLAITDDLGATGTSSHNVTVSTNLAPTASFTHTLNIMEVSFNDTSTDNDGAITAWFWDFGDNNSSTEQHPVHNYATSGNYQIKLTVTDNQNATGMITQSVVVLPPPGIQDIRITSSTDDVEQRTTSGYMFFNSSDLELGEDPTSNGDQSIGLRFNNVNIPANSTITAAYLEFTVDEPDSIATTMTIQAQAADNAPAFISTNYDLSSRPMTLAVIDWNIPAWNTVGAKQQSPDISPLVQEVINRNGWNANNSLVFVLGGDGERTAESYDGLSGSAVLLHVEFANDLPTAGFTESINGRLVSFTDASSDINGSITNWQWDFGDNSGSNEQHPTHLYESPGTYTVRLTVTDDLGATNHTSHDVTAVTGNIQPIASFNEIIDYRQISLNDTSTDTDGQITAWHWELGDGNTSVLQHPVHLYGADGVFQIQLTVTDNDGGTGITAKTINIAANIAPTASFTHTTNALEVTFNDTSSDSDGTIVSWLWDFGDGNSSTLQHPLHHYADRGTYNVQLTVTDDLGAMASSSHDISVVPPPDGILDIRISTGNDDVEERLSNGRMFMNSSDLELVQDPTSNGDQTVGLRFNNVDIPPDAIIDSAYLEFTVDESDSDTTDVVIQAQATDNAPAFSNTRYDLTSRQLTVAATPWLIPPWNIIGATQQSPNISSLIQEVVSGNGWNANNSLVFVISGNGERTAESYNGSSAKAVLLHVEYTNP